MTTSEINSIENEIRSIIRQQSSNISIQTSATASSRTASVDNRLSTGQKSNKKSLLDYFLDTIDNEGANQARTQTFGMTKVLNEEFKVYKKLTTQFVSTAFDLYDPIKFWKQNKHLLPNLAMLAQKYLASPSTSMKSESAFSVSSYYGRKQRNRISSDNLGFSVFLKDKLSA